MKIIGNPPTILTEPEPTLHDKFKREPPPIPKDKNERKVFSAAEVCAMCLIKFEYLKAYVEAGLVTGDAVPVTEAKLFSKNDMDVILSVRHLQYEKGCNAEAIKYIVHEIYPKMKAQEEQIEELQSELSLYRKEET